jgi:hypothetical protein
VHEHLAWVGVRVGCILVAQHLRAAILVDPDRLHGRDPNGVQGFAVRLVLYSDNSEIDREVMPAGTIPE